MEATLMYETTPDSKRNSYRIKIELNNGKIVFETGWCNGKSLWECLNSAFEFLAEDQFGPVNGAAG